MNNIQLLVFDIDGTLVDRSKETVEDSAVESINAARDKGYHILVATGRSFFFIHEDVRERINTEYYVTVNGACLNDQKGNIIETHEFSRDTLNTLIDYCAENKYPLGIKYDDHIGVYGDYDFFVKNYIGYTHKGIKHLVDDNEQQSHLTSTPLGVYCFAPVSAIDKIKKAIPALNFIATDYDAFEAIRQGVDKVKTIEEVIDRLDLTWDNVAAFGDGHNDVEMLSKAKYGVAMGNANDYVKSYADYVTTDIMDNGIKNALKHLKII
ncbi:MAG: HAD family hydrolase [Erysipelothrix sp.]|nr:HAD family hydrolase [Erysipelothrix sp.]